MTQHLRNSVTPRVGNYVTRSARKLRNFMTAHSDLEHHSVLMLAWRCGLVSPACDVTYMNATKTG